MRQLTHLTLSLAGLAALGPLAFDAVVPALPALGKEFSLSLPATQSLLALYLAALATSHLLSAWTANILGKRGVLLGAALLLCAGSAACALATRPEALQAGRILQGLGAGGVAALLPLLLLRTHSRRALPLPAENVIPILAPAGGALFVLYASWRYAFWLAAASALLVLLLLALAPAAQRKAGEPFGLAELTGNAMYWRYTVCHALCFGALTAGMASLPILVTLDLQLGAGHIALLQSAGALAMLLPALVTTLPEPDCGPNNMRLASGLVLLGLGTVFAGAGPEMAEGLDPFHYLLGCWVAMCAGFAMCARPLLAGALKAAGSHARPGLSLLQFASHAVAAAAILLTSRGDVEAAAIIAFGCAALMVLAASLLLPRFIWRSLSAAS